VVVEPIDVIVIEDVSRGWRRADDVCATLLPWRTLAGRAAAARIWSADPIPRSLARA